MKGIINTIIALVNICQFYLYFTPAVLVFFTIAFIFYLYAKAVVLQYKQLDLTNKDPIFQSFS